MRFRELKRGSPQALVRDGPQRRGTSQSTGTNRFSSSCQFWTTTMLPATISGRHQRGGRDSSPKSCSDAPLARPPPSDSSIVAPTAEGPFYWLPVPDSRGTGVPVTSIQSSRDPPPDPWPDPLIRSVKPISSTWLRSGKSTQYPSRASVT